MTNEEVHAAVDALLAKAIAERTAMLSARLAAAESQVAQLRMDETYWINKANAAERERDEARAVRDRALQNHALELQAVEARASRLEAALGEDRE